MLHAHCLGSTSPAARAAGASSPAPAAEHWHTRLFPAPDGSRTEVTVAHNGRSRIVLRRSGATAQPLTASIQPHAAPLADALICQFERPGRGGAAAIVALRAGGRGIEIVAPDAGGCSHQLPCAVRFVRGEPLPGGGALLQRDEAHAFETPNTAEGTTAAALWLLSQPLAPPRPLQLVDSAIIQLPPQARIQLLCAGPDDTVLLQVSHGDSSNQLVQAQLHRGRLQLEPLVVFKAHGAPLRTAWARRHGAVVAEGVTTDNKWLQFVQRGSPSAGEQVTEVAGVVSVVPVNLLYPEQPDGKVWVWHGWMSSCWMAREIERRVSFPSVFQIKLLPEVLVLRANGQLEYFVGGESVALVDGVTFGSDHEALVELRDSVNNRFTAVSSQVSVIYELGGVFT